MHPQGQTSRRSTPSTYPVPIERDLALVPPEQRPFFELVIVITRLLFVPIWLGLMLAWGVQRISRALLGGRKTRPSPLRPGAGYLQQPGCPLYLVGAYLAVVVALSAMIGMCFLPVMAVAWLIETALEHGSYLQVSLGSAGATALEILLLFIYLRYIHGYNNRSFSYGRLDERMS